MRDSFVFYRSFYEALRGMDKEVQAECLMALAQYALDGELPSLSPEVRMFMTLVKPQVDANNQRFVNGSKGGRPRKANNRTETKTEPENNRGTTEPKPNNNQPETKTEPNRNLMRNVNEKCNNPPVNNKLFTPPLTENNRDEAGRKPKKFNPPTYEDVLSYATGRGRADLAKQFFEYFTVGNWKDSSGKPVINWKQKFITWETHNQTNDPPKPPEISAEDERKRQEIINRLFED